ncbi:putative membrane protein [Nonomuraea africana]|uniref:Membrane protein n=2 Tax=Nonomuraea africana TaxID=46171 RepID=A0ABR9KSE4_9ACTN|nr:putative membrane protein [Nonomuraea africana]
MELLSIPFTMNALPVVVMSGSVGAVYLIALVMMILGVLLWLQPGQRVFLGVVAMLLSLASFIYSNLGGFLVGMSLGLVGGALAVAWTPVDRPVIRLGSIDVRVVLASALVFFSRAQAMCRVAPGGLLSPRRRMAQAGRDSGADPTGVDHAGVDSAAASRRSG